MLDLKTVHLTIDGSDRVTVDIQVGEKWYRVIDATHGGFTDHYVGGMGLRLGGATQDVTAEYEIKETSMKTIGKRAQETSEKILRSDQPVNAVIAKAMRELVQDCAGVADVAAKAEEAWAHDLGCKSATTPEGLMAERIGREIRALLPADNEPPNISIEFHARKMVETYEQWRRTTGAGAEEMRILFEMHLGQIVDACADVVDQRRREVVRQCGGDAHLENSNHTFTGYSVATMLAQVSDSIRDFSQHGEGATG